MYVRHTCYMYIMYGMVCYLLRFVGMYALNSIFDLFNMFILLLWEAVHVVLKIINFLTIYCIRLYHINLFVCLYSIYNMYVCMYGMNEGMSVYGLDAYMSMCVCVCVMNNV